MNIRQARLRERRKLLVLQCENQRKQMAYNIEQWRMPISMVDQGLAALRYINIHPLLVAGGFIIFATTRHGRIRPWLWRGWVTWQIAHKLRLKFQRPEESYPVDTG